MSNAFRIKMHVKNLVCGLVCVNSSAWYLCVELLAQVGK